MYEERRLHPRGEEGAKESLRLVVEKSREGRLDKRVRAWAVEAVANSGRPTDVVGKARAIFDRLVRERAYVEDPLDSEYIPSAACTLVGCHGLKFLGEDCDGLTVALLGALASVNIQVCAVAQAFDPGEDDPHRDTKSQWLRHVLGAFRTEDGKWARLDPSIQDRPFGSASKATREVWVNILNGATLCDGDSCHLETGGVMEGLSNADYVGFGAPPQVAQPALTDWSSAMFAFAQREIDENVIRMQTALESVVWSHWRLMAMRETIGIPLIDGPEQKATDQLPLWQQKHEDYYNKIVQAMELSLAYMQDAKSGLRPVAPSGDGEVQVLGNEDELAVRVEANGDIFVGRVDALQKQASAYQGHLGIHPGLIAVVVIVVGVVGTAGILTWGSVTEEHTKRAMQKDGFDFKLARIEQGATPAQANKDYNGVVEGVERQQAAHKEKLEENPAGKFFDTVKIGMYALIGVTGLIAGIWAVGQLRSSATTRRQEPARLAAA